MTVKDFDPLFLRELFDYDHETGVLLWRYRSRDMFNNDGSAKTWNKRFAGKPAFTEMSIGYLGGRFLGRHHYAHRVAWAVYTGETPKGQIDHINGVRSDNRICNLRDVSLSENRKNQRRSSKNTTGFHGVTFSHGKFVAQAKAGGVGYYLGRFDSAEDAHRARVAFDRANGFHENHGVAK